MNIIAYTLSMSDQKSERDKSKAIRIKLMAAVVLSFLYTCLFAFIIYGSLNYPLPHLVFDLSYAFVYFLLLHPSYKLLMRWLDSHFGVEALYQKYLVGLFIFIGISYSLIVLVCLIPFFLILGEGVGAIEWNSELRLNFVVNALVVSVYYFFLSGYRDLKQYHQALVNSEKLQKEIAQAQYEGLKNQVNPHFLFNSLNVLSTLVHLDADLSEKFIDQLAKAYRYLLEQRDQELVPLKTEIDFINSFVFLLKIRFEEKLKVDISIPAAKLNLYIPPLTLQLLLENAVKHNALSADSPLQVDIFVGDDDFLIVRNNLQVRQQHISSTGVGLKNITKRYQYLSSKKVDFQITGDAYVAKVPLIENQYESSNY